MRKRCVIEARFKLCLNKYLLKYLKLKKKLFLPLNIEYVGDGLSLERTLLLWPVYLIFKITTFYGVFNEQEQSKKEIMF